jgi:ABC-type sugar transport system ATPase subunit
MDEPLSNLDAKLRVQMRSEIVKIHENVGATTIYVTHDQTEAMTMANKIVVMNKGFIQQVGAPIDVYKKPKNRFVATFIGTPPMNIVKATYDGNNKKLYFANGLEINLTQEQIKKHDTFYLSRIQLLNEYIDTISQNGDFLEARKLYLSVTGYKKNDENEEVSTKKKSKLMKFIANIKEKSTRDAREQAEIDEMLENLKSMVEEYNSYLLNPHEIEVGIRPEHIYLKEQNKENCSSSFSLTTDIVEILGSEFVAYTNCELGKLTIKLQDPVKPHTMYDVVFNLDQIHLFDLVSTENIFY